ncbi:hypothetical protein OQ484_00040 [Pseudomonas aeruginosa]|uniref:hypothetical protein n=1 Tax=Pseudomonas aeruginosa TaxID=287 RepID=UPI002247DB8B|nr:hypothetical protein [Pseudomonas aeruginosa]MCX2515792.1 hypothetical protein [Pseudomonas aeruginosa]
MIGESALQILEQGAQGGVCVGGQGKGSACVGLGLQGALQHVLGQGADRPLYANRDDGHARRERLAHLDDATGLAHSDDALDAVGDDHPLRLARHGISPGTSARVPRSRL